MSSFRSAASRCRVRRPPSRPAAERAAKERAAEAKRERAAAEAKKHRLGAAGGCAADAAVAAGVWPSKEEAVRALNSKISWLAAKWKQEHGEEYPAEELAGYPGNWWHAEAFAKAVQEKGWHIVKVPTYSVATLRDGTYIIDGILNRYWRKHNAKAHNAPTYGGPGPECDEPSWRHAVAVRGGVVREQNSQQINLKWLWLNEHGVPDMEKGYMRKIEKVYRLWPCTGATGCRGRGGECS